MPMKIAQSQSRVLIYHAAILVPFLLASFGTLAQEEHLRQNVRRRQQGATPIREEPIGLDGGLTVDEYINIKEKLDEQQLFQPGNCENYSMTFRNENYLTPEINVSSQNWGRHALQWKGYLWNNIAPGTNTYDASLAAELSISAQNYIQATPHGEIFVQIFGQSDEVRLNELELPVPVWAGSSDLFAQSQLPGPVTVGLYGDGTTSQDPPGIWMQDFADGPLNGAIVAAIYMHLWGTPVYLNGGVGNPLVIEEVEICTSGSLLQGPPHVACDWDLFQPQTNQVSQGIYTCTDQTLTLNVNSITVRSFPTTAGPWISGPTTFLGQDWLSSGLWGCTPISNGPNFCPLVFDPPANNDAEVEVYQDVLKQIRHHSKYLESKLTVLEVDDNYDFVAFTNAQEYLQSLQKVIGVDTPEPIKEKPLTPEKPKEVKPVKSLFKSP